MKAYILHGVGDLRWEDCSKPPLQSGWVLVRVLAAGICSSDIPRIFEKGTYHFPTIPGHEFCGRVEAVADEEDQIWMNKRVGIFPLIPCKKCSSCQKGEYETCSHYDYIGSRRDGGFAEYAAVPVWNLMELPEIISDTQGAMLEPAAVALHAIKRAGISPDKSVCVVGTGAIGILAGQWAKLSGAGRVVVKGRGNEKSELIRQCGLEYTDSSNSGTFDCLIEAVGTTNALRESLSLAAPGGKIVLMGNPKGDQTLPQDVYWSILRKQLTLIGTWNSSYGTDESDWHNTLQALAAKKLRTENIITHIIDKDELLNGLDLMRTKREMFCKIMVTFQ